MSMHDELYGQVGPFTCFSYGILLGARVASEEKFHNTLQFVGMEYHGLFHLIFCKILCDCLLKHTSTMHILELCLCNL